MSDREPPLIVASVVPGDYDTPPLISGQVDSRQVASCRVPPQAANPKAVNSALGYSAIPTLLWFVGSLVVLALSASLTIGPQRRIYFPGLQTPVPETCALYVRLGLDCPGCGLTRSFIHIADGELWEAMRLNPAGIAIFLFIVAQIPAAIVRLAWGRASRAAVVWAKANEVALIVLPSLTCIQWFVRLSLGNFS